MVAALDVLAGLPGRRVAVLGEMLELGEGHESGHRAVGEAAAATVDLLVVVGEAATGIAEGAVDAGLDPSRITQCADSEAALDHLGRGSARATSSSSRRRAASSSTCSSTPSPPSSGPAT